MKRLIICLIFALCAVVLFTACGAQPAQQPAADPAPQAADPTPEAVAQPTPEAVAELYVAGTYEGKSSGHNGIVKASVTVSASEIVEIIVDAKEETAGIGSLAAEQLPDKIIEAQSVAVDTVTGATVTSEAVISAVEAALKLAVK